MALFSSCSDDAVAVRQQGVDTDPLTIRLSSARTSSVASQSTAGPVRVWW